MINFIFFIRNHRRLCVLVEMIIKLAYFDSFLDYRFEIFPSFRLLVGLCRPCRHKQNILRTIFKHMFACNIYRRFVVDNQCYRVVIIRKRIVADRGNAGRDFHIHFIAIPERIIAYGCDGIFFLFIYNRRWNFIDYIIIS